MATNIPLIKTRWITRKTSIKKWKKKMLNQKKMNDMKSWRVSNDAALVNSERKEDGKAQQDDDTWHPLVRHLSSLSLKSRSLLTFSWAWNRFPKLNPLGQRKIGSIYFFLKGPLWNYLHSRSHIDSNWDFSRIFSLHFSLIETIWRRGIVAGEKWHAAPSFACQWAEKDGCAQRMGAWGGGGKTH
jgi:hypothetical protein